MIVKIDNTESSSPQLGLSKADLITEELVEGGSTRLAVFFYKHVPKRVGPVRSMRATDIGIVKPAKAVLVASGGAPPTVRRIKGAGIKAYTEGATGYSRDTSRRAPYNLFMDLARLAKGVKAKDTVDSYLPFGSEKDLPQGQKASGLAAQFSGGHTTNWKYQGGKYVNQNSFAQAGDQFRPDNVLVLRVKVGDAGYKDPAGNPVPETKFTGTGKAMLFHGGRVVRGTWKKSPRLDHLAEHPRRRARGAGGSHLGRAGPRQRRQRHRHQVAAATGVRRPDPARADLRVYGASGSSPGSSPSTSSTPSSSSARASAVSSSTRSAGPGSGAPDSAIARRPARM